MDDAFKLQISKIIPNMMNEIGDSCVNDRSIGRFVITSKILWKKDVP